MKNLTTFLFCFFVSFSLFSQDLSDRFLNGKLVCIEFEQTAGVNLGTLRPGKQYVLTWAGGQMLAKGPSGKAVNYPLSKDRVKSQKISVWGFKATYDDNGNVFQFGTNKKCGKIYACENSPSTTW